MRQGVHSASPTQRSLQHLKALDYAAKVVERWNPFVKVRQDVFGADIIIRGRVISDTNGQSGAKRKNCTYYSLVIIQQLAQSNTFVMSQILFFTPIVCPGYEH